MAWTYEIDRLRGIAVVRVQGEFGDSDAIAIDERLRNDPDFRSHYNELVDLSESKSAFISPEAVRELASREPMFSSASRRAIVVATEFDFGSARMYELRRAGMAGEIRVFRDLDEALEWLNSS